MWLIKDMGLENFRDEVAKRMPGGKLETEGTDLVDSTHKRRDYHGVHKQKQEGLNYVGINVPAGRIQAKDMFEMATLADAYVIPTLAAGSLSPSLSSTLDLVLVKDQEKRDKLEKRN